MMQTLAVSTVFAVLDSPPQIEQPVASLPHLGQNSVLPVPAPSLLVAEGCSVAMGSDWSMTSFSAHLDDRTALVFSVV